MSNPQREASAKTFSNVQGTAEPRIVYHGREMTKSEYLKVRTGVGYCTLDITPEIARKGIFDARVDREICFDTASEQETATQKSLSTVKTYSQPKTSPNTDGPSPQSAGCAGGSTPRGNGYASAGFLIPFDDVCLNHLQTYLGGAADVNSPFIEGANAGNFFCIRENYFPPKFTNVTSTMAWARFIYVAYYRWNMGCT